MFVKSAVVVVSAEITRWDVITLSVLDFVSWRQLS